MGYQIDTAAAALLQDAPLVDEMLCMELGGCILSLRSNSAELIGKLGDYFSHVLCRPLPPDMEVIAIESEPPLLDLEYIDWKREPGKSGRKDAYMDIPDGRLILKVRTGMQFLQSETHRIAAGPCLRFDNQVINFINAQYMNWLQHRGWSICHASGLVLGGRCLGIAGFSGGGKSTLMLRLLDDERVSYLTNDRLFVRRSADATRAVGIPKLPRVNPGTIVHNERLHGLLAPEQRASLLRLPPGELWELEEKYDVHVEQVYGKGRIAAESNLNAFLVLNWQRDSDQPLSVTEIDLAERSDLLGAIMKSPGPFYQYPDGRFLQDTTPLDDKPYLHALEGIGVYEAKGGVDFEGLTDHCLLELMG